MVTDDYAGVNTTSMSIIEAIETGNVTRAISLIQEGANVNEINSFGWTPLHIAARDGKTGFANSLIKHHANIDVRDLVGQTPLHRAAFWGHLDICKLLVEAGGDFTSLDNLLQTPEELARIHGHHEVASYFQHCCVMLQVSGSFAKYSAEKLDRMNKQIQRKEREDFKRTRSASLTVPEGVANKELHKIKVLEEKIEEKRCHLVQKAEQLKAEILQLSSPHPSALKTILVDLSPDAVHPVSLPANSAAASGLYVSKSDIAKFKVQRRKLLKIEHQLDEYNLQMNEARRRSLQHIQTEFKP